MNRYRTLVLLLMATAALTLRWSRLDQRPMHNDEAVNAVKFGQLWQGGGYKYDPNEHHGPSLLYATYALGRLIGAPDFDHYTENRLRLITVLCGLGLVLLLPLIVDGLGQRGTLWAALFTAISPAMVFYSRYYIHEMLLVFSAFLSLAAGWRYWRTRQLGWALLAGLGLGLMSATKETFVLTFAAAGLAMLINHAWNRLLDASGLPIKAPPLNYWHLAAAFGIWLVVVVVLFTSFFTNLQGLLDFLRTYRMWLTRAAGDSPHIHPWHFYFHRLLWFHPAKGPAWTEAIIFALALVAAFAGFARKRLGRANASFVRFLTLYTFFLTAFYTLIGYKTPWCLLNFWHGMILLAGVGAAVLLRSIPKRPVRLAVTFVLLLATAHLAWQAWAAGTTYSADHRNPYTYAQTSPDILNLVSQVEALARVHSAGCNMPVKVMTAAGDCWPLPWYLRCFKQTGYWEQVTVDPYAPAMIVSAKFGAGLDEQKTHLMVRIYELRPQVFLELYVELDLWRAYLAKGKSQRDDRQ